MCLAFPLNKSDFNKINSYSSQLFDVYQNDVPRDTSWLQGLLEHGGSLHLSLAFPSEKAVLSSSDR